MGKDGKEFGVAVAVGVGVGVAVAVAVDEYGVSSWVVRWLFAASICEMSRACRLNLKSFICFKSDVHFDSC